MAKAKRSRKEGNRVATTNTNNKRRKTRSSGEAAVTHVELPSDGSPPDDSSDDEALTATNKRGIDKNQLEKPQLTKAEATAPPIRTTLESLKVVQAYCEVEGIGQDLCETLNTQIRKHWFEKALANFLPTVFE